MNSQISMLKRERQTPNGSLLYSLSLSASVIFLTLFGCRGLPSNDPPIHIVRDMDRQPKIKPQMGSPFSGEQPTMRVPPAGTVPQGTLPYDPILTEGISPETGKPIVRSPLPITMESLRRGQERFNIYCAACHGRVGDGISGVTLKGLNPPPSSLHTDLIRNYPDGYLFQVITNGVRTMPAYKVQIPVEDRWHIINYIRALQRSQAAGKEDLPPEVAKQFNQVLTNP